MAKTIKAVKKHATKAVKKVIAKAKPTQKKQVNKV